MSQASGECRVHNLCLRLQKEGKPIPEIAKLVFPKQGGKTAEQTIYNYLTIANTEAKIREALGKRRLQYTNALYLANCLKKGEFQSALNSGNLQDVIDEIARKKMSTRECEKMIKELLGTASNGKLLKKRRAMTEPAIFKEGKNGNWSLNVIFNTAKCENDLDLAVKIKSTLETALYSVRNFIEKNTVSAKR